MLNGKRSVPSLPGVIVSLLLYSTVISFAVQRGQEVHYKDNPNITPELVMNYFNARDFVDLDSLGFQLAFGVMDYENRSILDSAEYVEWHVYLETRKNLEVIDTQKLSLHRCDENDRKRFYAVSSDNANFLDELFAKQILYCIDTTQQLRIRGTDEIDSVALNLDYIGCNQSSSPGCINHTLADL